MRCLLHGDGSADSPAIHTAATHTSGRGMSGAGAGGGGGGGGKDKDSSSSSSTRGYYTIDFWGKKLSGRSTGRGGSTSTSSSSTMPGAASSSSSSSSSSQDPDVQRAIAVASRAVEQDEQGAIRAAFPLYQEAVGLFLAAVKKDGLGAAERQRLKEAAHNYLTRAEELKARIEAEDREHQEQQQKKKAGAAAARGRGSGKGGVSRSTAASRSAAAVAVADRATKPDDWDYTGGAGRGAGRGAGSSSGSSLAHRRPSAGAGGGGGAAVSGRAGSGPGSELEAVVMNEMLDHSPGITWDMIAGLAEAKRVLQEAVVLPNLRPDLFTGLRAPPRGVLLYGPPGTGKTMLAKAVASESNFAFFSISASSLVSKYVGDSERMVRALFAVARRMQPAVIFIDEIDSILSARKDNEHEASRRLKTEMLVQIDGAATDSNDRLLVMGATNLPWGLDTAVLRRMTRTVYIPLPDSKAREGLIKHMLKNQRFNLPAAQMARLVAMTDGYSCSDLTNLLKEASMEPLRELNASALRTVKAEQIRPLVLDDFTKALRAVRPSVPAASVAEYERWAQGLDR